MSFFLFFFVVLSKTRSLVVFAMSFLPLAHCYAIRRTTWNKSDRRIWRRVPLAQFAQNSCRSCLVAEYSRGVEERGISQKTLVARASCRLYSWRLHAHPSIFQMDGRKKKSPYKQPRSLGLKLLSYIVERLFDLIILLQKPQNSDSNPYSFNY